MSEFGPQSGRSQRIVVLGGGFAGLWSALGAARKLAELGIGPDSVTVTLVDRSAFHSIRVRNYEAELGDTRIPLDEILRPAGVVRVGAEVGDIDWAQRRVLLSDGMPPLDYDRLVFALGSCLARPPIPGLEAFAFDVDTYDGGARLNAHIAALPARKPSPGQWTALVIGGGLTGIEAACEMPGKLRAALQGAAATPRVIIADRQPWIGSDMGEQARAVIDEALAALAIEQRPGISVAAIDKGGANLSSGERIDAATIIWCGGMQAHPLTRRFPVERDGFGRVPVDEFLKIKGMVAEFAAGDVAWFAIDGNRSCVMSCQHGRPMGRFAGHNVVCDLLGLPMLPLRIDWYTTILDLGPWGAVCTAGWDRHVATRGADAKRTKVMINRERIYPPRTGDRREIFAAAAPVVQAPPAFFRAGVPNR
ncbi:MAG TPA: FAD-dependent oxidoreductase [Stellaceae bacterium]|nr:FAD-dependent oxidoreductase [Stellaceae bacterium]